MLSFIKQTKQRSRKPNILNHFSSGFAPKPFSPLNDSRLVSGYYMNLTSDTPQGSIMPLATDRKWLNMKTLNTGVKIFQVNANTVTTLVNGYKAMTMPSAGSYLQNGSVDLLTGVTNLSIVAGFKLTSPVDALNEVFFCRNNTNSIRFFCRKAAGNFLVLVIQTGGVTSYVTTSLTYVDSAWHALVAVLDQTSKKIDLYTDKGEHLTISNALLTMPAAFTPTAASNSTLGNIDTYTESLYQGSLGDVIYLNNVLPLADINQYMAWECNRLGIPYVVF